MHRRVEEACRKSIADLKCDYIDLFLSTGLSPTIMRRGGETELHPCFHPALIAQKWARQRGQISIPFSVHEVEYVSNLKSMTEDPLTEQEMARIATLERNNRLVKGRVFLWEGAKDWHDLWDEEE